MARVFVFVSRRKTIEQQDREWYNTISKINEPVVRFVDYNNHWYQQDYWPAKIQKEIDQHGHPALCFGSSMGAWAALYFQPIIKAKHVLAFNPQTTIDVLTLKKWGGTKNEKWARCLEGFGYGNVTLPKSDNRSTIYYGKPNKNTLENDEGHRQLAIKLGYNVITVPKTGHTAPLEYFKERNQLVSIIKEKLV